MITPAAPLHVYKVGDPSTAFPVGVALSVKLLPKHIVLADVETVIVGVGATE